MAEPTAVEALQLLGGRRRRRRSSSGSLKNGLDIGGRSRLNWRSPASLATLAPVVAVVPVVPVVVAAVVVVVAAIVVVLLLSLGHLIHHPLQNRFIGTGVLVELEVELQRRVQAVHLGRIQQNDLILGV